MRGMKVGRAGKGRGAFESTGGSIRWVAGSTGLGAAQDRVSRELNAYAAKGGKRVVRDVISSSSKGVLTRDTFGNTTRRVFRGTDELIPVKFSERGSNRPNVGWLYDGRIVAEDELLNALRSLDSARGVDFIDDVSLVKKYLEASPEEQAQMAERLLTGDNPIDWNELFGEVLYKEDEFGDKAKADEQTVEDVHDYVGSVMMGLA